MINSFRTKTVAIAAVGVLSIGGVGAAVAATTASNAPTPLTGSITEQAAKAALAKYPGATLVGIRSEPDGTYEADVRKSDGTAVGVELDKDFKVTGTHAGHPGGPGGPGGRWFGRGADTAALAKTLGVTEAKLQAALEATHGKKDDRAATIAKALGATTADVEAVLEAQRGNGPGGRGDHRGGRPGGPGGPGGPGNDSALVTALAKKTGKSEADVTEALEALRTERESAAASALAKELGIDAAKVKAALEAAKPDRPADRP